MDYSRSTFHNSKYNAKAYERNGSGRDVNQEINTIISGRTYPDENRYSSWRKDVLVSCNEYLYVHLSFTHRKNRVEALKSELSLIKDYIQGNF
ncbi:MAG: hypothetical protein IPJ13_21150 [Saprospiraceae bacterium]|nr:hypothetical protein [Saprospiraceae bacterium]